MGTSEEGSVEEAGKKVFPGKLEMGGHFVKNRGDRSDTKILMVGDGDVMFAAFGGGKGS